LFPAAASTFVPTAKSWCKRRFSRATFDGPGSRSVRMTLHGRRCRTPVRGNKTPRRAWFPGTTRILVRKRGDLTKPEPRAVYARPSRRLCASIVSAPSMSHMQRLAASIRHLISHGTLSLQHLTPVARTMMVTTADISRISWCAS